MKSSENFQVAWINDAMSSISIQLKIIKALNYDSFVKIIINQNKQPLPPHQFSGEQVVCLGIDCKRRKFEEKQVF